MSTINGSSAATLNQETTSFTPFQGGEYGGRYEGPLAAIVTKYNLLRSQGYAVHLESDSSPIATCTFRAGFQSASPGGGATNPNLDYQDTWEIVRNTTQKELLMSDHPSVAALNSTNLAELKAFMADQSSWDDSAGILNFTITDTSPYVNSSVNALYLFDLFQSGVRSVEVKQPILRLTRVTNPFYDAVFNVDNVDVVLTTSSMISDSGVPSNFAVPLLALAAALTGTTDRADSLDLAYGWLKDMVSSTITGNTRVQYVIEWKFGLWDTILYNVPT